jgi:cell division septum initiation protein DivIVA
MVAHHAILVDRNHELKLAERQDTIFNLKGQIEDLKEQQQAEIAQVSRDAANEIADLKLKHGEEVKGLNDKYEQAQAEASDISQALEALREKIKGWEKTASAIDAKLNGKPSIPRTFSFCLSYAFF